ncbi:MAG TPA: 4-hydroxy-tetrahydrodipicolinate synthase [Bacteroidales bacterium]|nr:4-hydroxy-tetrahydrodipicolinate synthase [Bacteroidales bacterium]
MKVNLSGTGVALVTPFHKYGTIDFSALNRLLQHVIEGGVDYLVVMGTTGESVTLSKDEKTALIQYVVEVTEKRVPIVLGIGGNNTQELVNTIKTTDFEGISAILSVSPYYNKPQQQGIFHHFKTLAAASPLPMILYNVPGRTASNMTAQTTLSLAREVDNIIGIKEASGNLVQIMDIIRNKPKDFLVISGDDILTFPLMTLGADGVISVVANACPQEFSSMVRLAKEGNTSAARDIHYRLAPFINELFADGSPSGIKAALEIMGICENNLRLPLVKVEKHVYQKLNELIKSLKA